MKQMQTAKELLGRSLAASGLDALLVGDAAVIVTFHRVHDGAAPSDSLTVSVQMFESYCCYFKRWFRVVPLRTLVDRLKTGRLAGRELAITFDDGYLDNFENAAPVLERLSLPATFFVVTQWMDSEIVPFWDERRGVRHPWMTWDNVSSLHQRGFEIGVHTRTHVNLGRVSGSAAADEILGARLELEDRLSAPATSFAYPFGGRRHLTEENRELVQAAGFACCCSGFGGINLKRTDPFSLLRIPISNFYASPYQFVFDLALGRTALQW
ncbi:MAG TPA: polysaccharide deacetylase family protein [Vicinamibacterales bacterium]